MKALLITSLLALSTLAHADFVPNDDSRDPVLACKNESLLVQVMTLPNQKDLQMVVRNQRIDSLSNVVYNAVVHPVVAENMHVFINAQTSLRVAVDGDTLKGQLNLNRTQPGVGMTMECQTYALTNSSSYRVR